MDRLTSTKRLPPEGTFIALSEEERREIQYSKVNERDIYKRLQEYENTGLTPDEISAIKADNDRLHALLDEIESELPVPRKMKQEVRNGK